MYCIPRSGRIATEQKEARQGEVVEMRPANVQWMTMLLLTLTGAQALRLPPVHRPLAQKCAVPRLSAVSTAAVLSTTAWVQAAQAAEVGGPPIDDRIVVAFALLILGATGALTLSLGDVVGDEAQLPSSVNLINKNRKRRSTFIKSNKTPPS